MEMYASKYQKFKTQFLKVDGRIILKWIFKSAEGEAWTGLIWVKIGTGGGVCECGNEPSGSTKLAKLLD
jgi:hypothetical protein